MNYHLLLLFLLLAAGLRAQVTDTIPDYRRFQLGVTFGMMEHELDVTPAVRQEPLTGSSYGLALRYFDNRIVGFQAELSYVQAGWRERLDTSGVLLEELYERQTSYAELLILTQLSIGQGVVQPMLQAGPYFSFPLAEKERLPPGYEAPATNPPVYYGQPFPFRINYGGVVAAGLNIEAGPFTIQGQGRYLIGFSDLVRTGNTTASTSRRAGLGWQANLFFTF